MKKLALIPSARQSVTGRRRAAKSDYWAAANTAIAVFTSFQLSTTVESLREQTVTSRLTTRCSSVSVLNSALFDSPHGEYRVPVLVQRAKKGGKKTCLVQYPFWWSRWPPSRCLCQAWRRKPPKPGDYRGHAKSTPVPDVHDNPPLHFKFSNGKVKQFSVYLPIACGTGGAFDPFDAPFGTTLGKVSAQNGKFKAVEESDVNSSAAPGGSGHIKATFKGKISRRDELPVSEPSAADRGYSTTPTR